MPLSDSEFTAAEMREMEEAAAEAYGHSPHEKARRMPKGSYLAALKLTVEHNDLDAVAVIAGISRERLRGIIG